MGYGIDIRMLDVHFLLMAVQFLGTIIPVLGIFFLINKEQSRISTNLMVADIGCIIMNASYFLLLRTMNSTEAILALKIEYLGNVLFYFFFLRFLIDYMELGSDKTLCRIANAVSYIWLAWDIFLLFLLWDDGNHRILPHNLDFYQKNIGDYSFFAVRSSILYQIRYGILSVVILGLMVYMLARRLMIRSRNGREKHNLSHLLIATGLIFLPLPLKCLIEYSFDILPLFSSAAVFMIILGAVENDLLNVAELGRAWVFDKMEDTSFIIVDGEYGFLDANESARRLFPELRSMHKGDDLHYSAYWHMDNADRETEVEIGGRYYERYVTRLEENGTAKGYCLVLIDMTKQYKLMDELKAAKEKAEDANRAKSDFISNISHEIRTPMNAIVGMTEILLRGEMEPQERNYLLNIKNSGAALLTIINDILDFSKMESGRMEIVEDEYAPMSMFSDLGMIFLNRIGEKPIELIFDIDRELPMKLYGDSLRLRQVIINIVNNAIKFTETGSVTLTVLTEAAEEAGGITLHISVKDTGQGIKEEDIGKLFGAFQQVDTRRNRNKEGTGLGLSISRRLVELMGGEIGVKSEYGKGSEFYFSIPQRVVGEKKAAVLKGELAKVPAARPYTVSGLMDRTQALENLKKLTEGYGLCYQEYEGAGEKGADFLFVEERLYPSHREELERLALAGTEICVLHNPMLEGIGDDKAASINKPLYSLTFCQALNHDMTIGTGEGEDVMNFTAPEAQILIVDDNEINLKVATGLLEPLRMKIDTADSGKKALEMIQSKKYHIVFMDHMMPVMDGVETTRRIRELRDEYAKALPIIALTAAAAGEARAAFQQAGMDDFVAKPIETREICSKIREYLPRELVHETQGPAMEKEPVQTRELPVLEGIDAAAGVKNSGSYELFINLLGDFYKLIDMKANKMEKCLADGMLRDYTIEAHGLKNTARMIGALELSERFYQMEQYGNAGDMEAILRENPALMESYRGYKAVLAAYGRANEENKKEVPAADSIAALERLRDAMDGFDLDGADAALAELEGYRLPQELSGQMERLRAFVADVAMEDVIRTADEMAAALKEQG